MTLTLALGVGDGGRGQQISEVYIANSILGQLQLHSETLLKQTNKTKQQRPERLLQAAGVGVGVR